MKSAYNSGRNELICKLYESGKSTREIGKMVGLYFTSVANVLRRNNIPMRPAHRIASGKPRYIPRPRKSKVNIEELRKLVAQRKSANEIAEHFGCTVNTVNYQLRKHGLYLNNVTSEEIAKMREFRELGLTNEQIAKRIGRTYETVLRHIGHQPSEITENSVAYRVELRKLRSKRSISGKAIMEQKRIDEARIEAERKAAEEAARREEEARVTAETSIREILVACGLPSEIHIETSAQGNAILANMKNRFAAAAAAA